MKELESEIEKFKDTECLKLVVSLLLDRREKHRDSLESGGDHEIRGRAKECKYLIKLFKR